jgi:hypothetical protein
MKKIGTFFIAAMSLVFVAGCGISGLTTATNTLFSDIETGNIQAAYNQTAKEFQTAATLDQFKTFLQQSNLATTKSTARSNVSVTNNQGKLV